VTFRPLGIAPRALGEEYSPMWVDLVSQKGSLPTAAITRDGVTSLWRNSPNYYYLPPGTAFQQDTGKRGVYGAQIDVAMPVKTQTGELEFMSLPVTMTFPIDAVVRDVASSKIVQDKLGSSMTLAGGAVAGIVMMTAGVTLFGVWLLLRKR
jgi:hypothetical protein